MRQTIQNEAGDIKECEAVDAREHIATGRWVIADQNQQEPKRDIDLAQREATTKQAQEKKVRRSRAK